MSERVPAPKLAVVSYPVLEATDREWIESLRRRHDPQAGLLPAHVTFVFPTDLAAPEIAPEIAGLARESTAIPFVIRWARPIRDVFGAGGHVFLVPDEGFGAITALHHALYSGGFAASRLPDVPFIPHITVGAAADFARCEQIAQDLMPLDRQVHGRLESVDLLEIGDHTVSSLGRFMLGAG